MSDAADDATEAVEVPSTALTPAALRGVIEAYVLREGTEYGDFDYDLADKVAQVQAQLERGEARIVFDAATRSVDIQRVPQRARRGDRT